MSRRRSGVMPQIPRDDHAQLESLIDKEEP